MDWMRFAGMDWEIYGDVSRIAQYVIKGKITAQQYQDITGEAYEA